MGLTMEMERGLEQVYKSTTFGPSLPPDMVESIKRSLADAAAGRVKPASEVFASLGLA